MNTPSRHELTRNVFAVIIILMLIGFSFWILSPFFAALAWATTIVIASWPIMKWFQSKLFGRRALAVTVMTCLLLLMLFLPLTIALSAIVDYAPEVSERIRDLVTHGVPAAPQALGDIPLIGKRAIERWEQLRAGANSEETVNQLRPYVGQALSWVVGQIGGVGVLLIHFLLTVLIAAILYARGEDAAQGLVRFARRLAGGRGEQVVRLAGQAVRAVAIGVLFTAGLQAALTAIALAISGVPYVAVISSITLLLCVVQIGAGPVLLLVLLWLYNSQETWSFVVFLVFSLIIMISDNFVRPILIKRGADLPLLLIFAGVVGGLLSFGIIGLFVGPVILAVSYTLIQAWIAEQDSVTGANSLVAREAE